MSDYIIGLDLGQAQDYTAAALLERRRPQKAQREARRDEYACRWLKRWPLLTPYTDIVAELADLVKRPVLNYPMLAVDQTGVGRAVVDVIRAAGLQASLNPVLITGGHQVGTGDDGAWHVPKKELVSTLQVLLQSRRLQIASRLEYAATLTKELLAFRVKITTAANETFEAWRERDHDDLVLAVAMAAWLGEHSGQADGPVVVRAADNSEDRERRTMDFFGIGNRRT